MAETKPAEGIQYFKPRDQVDLENRLKANNAAPTKLSATTAAPKDTPLDAEGYIGVAPEYQNYADDTNAPYQSDEGADKLLEDAYERIAKSESVEASDKVKAAYKDVTPGTVGASTTPSGEGEKPADNSDEASAPASSAAKK